MAGTLYAVSLLFCVISIFEQIFSNFSNFTSSNNIKAVG